MKKRITAVLVTSIMIFSLFSAPALAAISEDTEGHWAETEISRWVKNDVINLREDAFAPNEFITRGEIFKAINTIFAYKESTVNPFSDLSVSDWYYDHAIRLAAAGILKGDGGKVNGEDNITRQEAFVLFARIFKVSPFELKLDEFSDAADVADWAKDDIGGMLSAGYLNGDGGALRPRDGLTRAEAAKILDNIIDGYFNAAGSYSEVDSLMGTSVVNTKDVVIQHIKFDGDLYVTQGVGDGDFTMADNTVVLGTMYAMGGGVNSVHVLDGSNVFKLVVMNTNGALRVYSEKSSFIETVYITEGSDPVTLDGYFINVIIHGGTEVNIANATIENLIISGSDTLLNIDGSSEVTAISLTKDAENAGISVASRGKVGTITSNTDKFEVTGRGNVGKVVVL